VITTTIVVMILTNQRRSTMRISLERAVSPEYMEETDCGICEVPFRPESVIAWDERSRAMCPDCVWFLGERNPERFPSIRDYRAAVERYPEPMYPSEEAIMELEEEDHRAGGRVLAASRIG
jgi:hypothetical protein